ncbi:serine/threonine-protein kinase [Phytohabitans sp. ZYX-F-186]|uniref:non-specific serine/threonine protein kinase n=1 Tax=Phytohabitans maris TaxID=3071409 RepID=A0ABU0ZF23_9ACTN|nr:serine/threonine-protein kinase [Phytohabitans sp. ZYX-F-186]MDQ7905652.1 serine/threonine-protein kinase [Phytohabitans sp. ZYX-F-186]
MTTGTVIAGRYRLREAIGSGGMGQVWLAADDMLGRNVAVKEVTTPDSGEFATVRQSLREARSAASLNHPNVVQIHDILHTDRPWIVMEYVPSRSLYDVIVRDGPLSPRDAARVGLGMLAGLRAAHRAGIIHRDVKPQNVLVGHDGRVVLTDFGLAVRQREGAAGRAEALIGSPQYIAPERVRDGASTPATDMWSLGATLYAAVEGRAPYQRETTTGTLLALASEPPDPPRRAGPLAPALLRLLERDPARRADADAVERLLRPIAEGVPRPAERSPDEAALARLTRIQLAVASFVLAATATVAVILATGWS